MVRVGSLQVETLSGARVRKLSLQTRATRSHRHTINLREVTPFVQCVRKDLIGIQIDFSELIVRKTFAVIADFARYTIFVAIRCLNGLKFIALTPSRVNAYAISLALPPILRLRLVSAQYARCRSRPEKKPPAHIPHRNLL